MKTIACLTLALAATLLSATTASAHWKHKTAAVPVTGYGFPMLPPVAPVFGGGGMSLQMSMSGDALLALPFLRGLVERFLGVGGPTGMTEAQLRVVAERVLALAAGGGASPTMTAAQALELIKEFRTLAGLIRKNLGEGEPIPAPKGSGGDGGQTKVKQLLNEIVTRQNARAATERVAKSDQEAEVKSLLAQITARQAARANGGATTKVISKADDQRLREQITTTEAVRKALARANLAGLGN